MIVFGFHRSVLLKISLLNFVENLQLKINAMACKINILIIVLGIIIDVLEFLINKLALVVLNMEIKQIANFIIWVIIRKK
jgi:hypothetical protein